MASLQMGQGAWRVLFCYASKLHSLPIGKVSEKEARHRQSRIEELLMRLKQRLMEIPPGIGIIEFMEHDGKPPIEPEFQHHKTTTLGQLRDQYVATYSNGGIEANTLTTAKIHLAHIQQTLGKASCFPVDASQPPIAHRSPAGQSRSRDHQEGNRQLPLRFQLGRPCQSHQGAAFPSRGLVYAKTTEKLPFMTWKEIDRRIKAGGDLRIALGLPVPGHQTDRRAARPRQNEERPALDLCDDRHRCPYRGTAERISGHSAKTST